MKKTNNSPKKRTPAKPKLSTGIEHNPYKNHNAISVIQQEDGNWKGYMHKHGKDLVVREATPSDCIVKLITHP